ncbi:MAG TPA: cysteine hydrolase family protein [Terriglobales bacterium]|nr:cysteine hydrolase family protein [Terriglobales bacterium]
MQPSRTALILVDVQKGFDDPVWGRRNNLQAEKQMVRLLSAFRERQAPIFHFQHLSQNPNSPLYPGRPGSALKDEFEPISGEPLLTKKTNSCFIGTPLEEYLRKLAIEAVVICGFTTDHCVSSTARMGANLGFRVHVASDATATFERVGPEGHRYPAEVMHDTALASLNEEFAIVGTSDLLIQKLFTEPA